LQQDDKNGFELLKKKIVEVMQQSFPGISPSISEWKGQDIVNFQEELLQKVNAHISEKWFYTHMKSDRDTLPRIDILNLLSKYAGYSDWGDFVYRNGGKKPAPIRKSGNKYFLIVPLMALGIMAVLFLLFKLMNTREYTFCFYDINTKEPITNTVIEVSLIMENESPVNYLCGPDGCFSLKTDESYIRMVVNAPYYRNDTIRRTLKKFNPSETIGLQANEYALMIKYFAEENVTDWQKRRQKLDEMFDDGAMIYQVLDNKNETGMELYTKWEFIDKLTMPTQSLKNIEILNTIFTGDRIAVLRFMISEEI
jgi:hypothetical protein